MSKLFKMWRTLLPFIFLFVFVHLLKDITQDIFGIKTPLDVLGDVKEDVSKLSPTTQNLYFYGLGGLSFIAEAFLLISIPIVRKRKAFTKLEKATMILVGLLVIYFLTAITLDPRYRPF